MGTAIEECAIPPVVIGRSVHHSLPTIRAIHQPGKHAAVSYPRHPMPLGSDHLHLFKHIFINDSFMRIREDGLFLNGILALCFVPERVGLSAEIDGAACILPAFQDFDNGAA